MRELFISALITAAIVVAMTVAFCAIILWPRTSVAVMCFGFLFMLVHSARSIC